MRGVQSWAMKIMDKKKVVEWTFCWSVRVVGSAACLFGFMIDYILFTNNNKRRRRSLVRDENFVTFQWVTQMMSKGVKSSWANIWHLMKVIISLIISQTSRECQKWHDSSHGWGVVGILTFPQFSIDENLIKFRLSCLWDNREKVQDIL